MPPVVAPHPEVELVKAAVAGVGSRISGPSGTAPLRTEAIGDGGLRVIAHEACRHWHRNAARDILDVADV